MSANLARLKKRAAELEQKKLFDKALEVYIQILEEGGKDLGDDDVPLFNRVGDMLMRKGEVTEALGYYERAVDMYAERGFLNNAIALCSKILRQSPMRTAVYYKLGRISARKGFKSDARKNFLEYADRMQKAGKSEEAFRALKEFAALYPDQDDVRLILAELLSKENRKGEAIEQLQALYDKLESEGRQAEARATVDRMKAIDPNMEPRSSGSQQVQQAADLVFLDLSDDTARSSSPSGVTPADGSSPEALPPAASVPALDGLTLTFVPEENEGIDAASVERPSGFEATAAEGDADMSTADEALEPVLAEVDGSAGLEIEPLDLEPDPVDADVPAAGTLEDLEPTAFDEPASAGVDEELLPGRSTELDAADESEPRRGEAELVVAAEDGELVIAEDDAGSPGDAPAEPSDEARAAHEAIDPEDHVASDDGYQPVLETAGLAEGNEYLELEDVDESDDADDGDQVGEPAESGAGDGGEAARDAETISSVRDHLPLTESEFDDLHLTDVHRAMAQRAHDLSLPGQLPDTPEFVRASSDTPSSQAASDDARAAAEEDADLMADLAAREAVHRTYPPRQAFVAREDRALESEQEDVEELVASNDALFGAADDHPDEVNGDEMAPGSSGDFMSQPPSFGTVQEAGDYSFPPLDGLDDSPGQTPNGESGHAWVPDELSEQVPAEDPPATAGMGSPRSTLSIGGAEDHLRQRLELEPENWQLRRLLGEALLDAGNRDGGLYELELAMVGLELDADIDRAAEVVDVILSLLPGSVRHHQKRVEYAVRTRDRGRLIQAYLDLADALFRNGVADKAASVYSRVLELDGSNDHAEFALSTLAPDELTRVRGGPARPDRWSDELEAIPGATATAPAPLAPSIAVAETANEALVAADGVDDAPPESEDRAAAVVENAGLPDSGTKEVSETEPPQGEVAGEVPAPSADERDSGAGPPDSDLAAVADDADVVAASDPIEAYGKHAPAVSGEPGRDEAESADDLAAMHAWGEAPDEGAAQGAGSVEEADEGARDDEQSISRLEQARSLTPAMVSESDFVDLGEWLRTTEPSKSTRMMVEDPKPTGDEQADFEELLRRFKRGVAENVEAEDYEAHYDLGVAFKEMGLIDEAIAQFQKSLRGATHRVRSYEALGQCFVEKEQYPIAAALLQRATELPGTDDQQLVGVLYLLGFATEHLGRPDEALPYYLRVFAVDIEFRDIAARVEAMGNPTK